MKALKLLQERGLVRVVGALPDLPRLAMLAWARKPPKSPFKAFVSLNNQLSTNALSVFVDDLCAMVTLQRGPVEQTELNEQYRHFFSDLGCKTVFSQEILSCDERKLVLDKVMQFASRVSLSAFMHILPGHKKRTIQDLNMGELLHGIIELMCLEEITKTVDGIVMGEMSLEIAMLHRDICPKPLSIVAIPHFSSENAVSEYIRNVES